MASFIIRDATWELAERMLPKVRQMDVDEWVMGSGGRSLRRMLKECIETSPVKRVVLHGKSGEPFAMWGAAPGPDKDYALAWALGTDDVSSMGRVVHLRKKEELALLHRHFPRMAAAVWERNASHVKWLRAMGFVRQGLMPGPMAIPLALYTREAP